MAIDKNIGVNIDTAPGILRKLADGREYRSIRLQDLTARARENENDGYVVEGPAVERGTPPRLTTYTGCMMDGTTRWTSRSIHMPLMSATWRMSLSSMTTRAVCSPGQKTTPWS